MTKQEEDNQACSTAEDDREGADVVQELPSSAATGKLPRTAMDSKMLMKTQTQFT